jgi:hypothetical protein
LLTDAGRETGKARGSRDGQSNSRKTGSNGIVPVTPFNASGLVDEYHFNKRFEAYGGLM